jgi:tRNA-binding protein
MSDGPFDVEVRAGTVREATSFDAARKPEMVKLEIDLGDRRVTSAAQFGYHHEPAELVDRQVLVVTNLEPVTIAGFTSEVLTLGAAKGQGWVAVTPEQDVQDGVEVR